MAGVAIRPGPRNGVGDVTGVLVGSAEDRGALTGVTVLLPAAGALRAAIDVRGGAPGTVNSDALTPGGMITELHGLAFAGGSVFGLEAVAGLTVWLAGQGRGFQGWGPVIPCVAGAILFDLVNGGDKSWGDTPPYRNLAQAAAASASPEPRLGNVGAGLGAVAGAYKGGLGTASAFDSLTGVTVAALVVVNSVGSPAMPAQPTLWAWYLEQDAEAGGQPPPTRATGHAFETKRGIGSNTTIGAVVTDADLTQPELRRLAVHGQDGLAMAIRPIHTQFDGDTVFALTTAATACQPRPDLLVRLGTMAADVMARAVMRAVFEAATVGQHRSWRETWGR